MTPSATKPAATFAPIAIVGQACVLPGALSPAELWEAVAQGRDLLGRVPEGRWRLPAGDDGLRAPHDDDADRSWSDRGGYVTGFESVWNPDGFALPADELGGLDPLVHWVLHCAREALGQGLAMDVARVGAVFGNLGFPSEAMADYAARVWRRERGGDTRNRYMSSGTAEVVAQALGLGAGSFCLDAACASSLYAIKLACDALHAGRADAMLAGAVQRADDLFLHVGFCALSALSRTGRSRPFDQAADGLVPAEGAAMFLLKRLDDARRGGDRILGVIRGIGLSNDGRGKGLLAPDEAGQQRAMQQALAVSGVDPEQVSMIECHATGTPVGDATELRSTASVYAECNALPIGSLKSNLGHLITTAGAAGLIKTLEAMRHGQRAPTLHVERANPALANTPFRLLGALEDWPKAGPRTAAVSAFGFGGNNAHLIVSEDDPSIAAPLPQSRADEDLVVVGIGARVASLADRTALTEAWFSDASVLNADGEARMQDVEVDLAGLRLPPRDLEQTLPQQLAMLEAAREAMAETSGLVRERTAVLIGMEPDGEVARYGLRWRLQVEGADEAALRAARDGVVAALESAAVLGCMPNIPANRLSSQLDLAGPAFTLQAGAASGLRALQVAADALRAGDIDAALVGAVDMACEPVQRSAMDTKPGDAAVALVVKRLPDAEKAGDRIYARINVSASQPSPAAEAEPFRHAATVRARFAHAPAALGLLEVVLAALSLHHRRHAGGEPWLAASGRTCAVSHGEVGARLDEMAGALRQAESPPPRLRCFAGADREAVVEALIAGKEGREGPARLVLVCKEGDLPATRDRALAHLRDGMPAGQNIQFRDKPIGGAIGFAFAGAGAAYAGMGRALVHALPELVDHVAARSRKLAVALDVCYRGGAFSPTASEQLQAASALSQIHVELSERVLGLRADAWLGYSSGETNALFGSGVWSDPDALIADMDASGLMDRELGGEFEAVARAWGESGSGESTSRESVSRESVCRASGSAGCDRRASADWASWTVLAPLDEVRAAIATEPRVHLAIINSDQDSLIAGESSACARVVEQLGAQRCLKLGYALAAHVPEVLEARDAWRELHTRPSTMPRTGRVYSNAFGGSYEPDSKRCADALLQQAVTTLDVRPTILRAWEDGVRVFIEHGPGGTYARAIRDALGEREALVVSLDRRNQDLEDLLCVVASLIAAGVPVDDAALMERLQPARRAERSDRLLRLPAHPPAVVLPKARAIPSGVQRMRPAPKLPSLLAESQFSRRAEVDRPAASNQPCPRGPAMPAAVHAARSSEHEAAALPAAIAAAVTAPVSAPRAGDWLGEVSVLHARFLEESARAQQQFLAFRQSALQSLARAAGVGGTVGEVRSMPAPPAFVPPAAPAVAPLLRPVPPLPSVSATAASANHVPSEPATPLVVSAEGSEPAFAADREVGQKRDASPRPGPRLDRAQLEVHASGRISEIYGPQFAGQDHFIRQVRMPEPPLLLADRVVGIEGEAGKLGKGCIWTETDVGSQDWYLHHGYMPAGVMIEAGQADLMLISWQGIDNLNRGERVYRLLGCELTYHGDLPKVGERLEFEISLDGHAAQGDVRLMFFHYDCMNGGRRQLSVRAGQAGFFTDAELAESAGCLWRPEDQEIRTDARVDAPVRLTTHRSFDRAALERFAEGGAADCFGEGFAFARTHTRSPSIHGGRMLLQDRITDFDASGGPWGRGYLRAELDIRPDLWFFDGHFKNDPCMPGTLMFEGCLQMMAFYLAGCGFTLQRDGWRFQPVPDEPYKLQCRGQVIPSSKQLVTEIFVEEVHEGPVPTLYADLLCTVDGLKAFHARRVGVQLVPDWPLDNLLRAQPLPPDHRACAVVDGFRFDQRALLACAVGRPSEAFGPMYRRFDAPGRVPRLPTPPYHFISRIAEIEGPIGAMRVGARVVAEYDVPRSVWYFDENGCARMPFAVLLEVALQPCGWLASYVGSALTVDGELGFRNLDGEGEVLAELAPGCGTISTEVRLTDVSAMGGMIIQNFQVECRMGEQPVYRLRTVFGFFPPEALAAQAGLPKLDTQFELLGRASNCHADLSAAKTEAALRLPGSMLRMIDRVEGFWPGAGAAGLGQLRAVKWVDSDEWFFKAHFFQDPVQPGSLGLEAMLQLLQWYLLETGAGEGLRAPRFQSIGTARAHRWKYRGQVLPHHATVHTTMEISECGSDALGRYATATASLWADGQRIYEAEGLCVRVMEGG
ncbi:MAG: hypothetical protein KDJ14_07350 [Xanthomonadales bacterium]|nr:hypothetical protein [Xanthomonadales bacterium]